MILTPFNQKTADFSGIKNVLSSLEKYNNLIKESSVKTADLVEEVSNNNASFGQYLTSLNGSKASLGGYVKSLFTASSGTALLTLKTIVLNAALTIGIGFAISLAI
ncbi:hypothetical protein [Caproiciproducens sp.]